MKHTHIFIVTLLFSSIATSHVLAADAPQTFPVGGLTFTSPTEWTWVTAKSPMRKAQFKVETADGAAEVVFFHFGKGQGGSVQANVDRWLGQFAESKDKLNARTEKKTVAGREITYVFAEGTYMSGPPFGQKTPLKNQALIGAIIKNDDGDVFVKMTGLKIITNKAEPTFKKLVESANR